MSLLNQTIMDLMDRQSISFISSVDSEGFPNTKAVLSNRKREGLRYFYFTTNLSSMRVRQYKENEKANVYFCDPTTYQGVMLVGSMEVLEDPASREMIWREGDTLYYPGGVNDPDYCVLKFTAGKGRYYFNLHTEDFNIDG